MPVNHFTNTLQSVLNFCSTQADLIPLTGVGGFNEEPGLSMCNDALAGLLTATYNLKINRKDYPNYLVTAPFKQDYIWGGASAFTILATQQGWAISLASNSGITVTGGVVTVNTLELHGFAVGDTVYLNGVAVKSGSTGDPTKYNSVITTNTTGTTWSNGYLITAVTPNSFSFAAVAGQNNGDVLGAPGIADFGWMQESVMYKMSDTGAPQFSKYLYAKRQLPIARVVADPESISVLADNMDGTLTVRFYYCPGTISYGAKLTYQMAAPVKIDVTQNWAPFPDHYAPLYRQAVVYLMYRYLNSPRADSEFKKLQLEIAKVAGFDDNEQTDVHMQPTVPLLDDGVIGTNFWW